MTQLSKQITDKAIKDPDKIYHDPKEVLADDRLTDAEKRKIIDNWLVDQKALLRADNENMAEQPEAAQTPPEDPAVMIAELQKAKRLLEEN